MQFPQWIYLYLTVNSILLWNARNWNFKILQPYIFDFPKAQRNTVPSVDIYRNMN